MTKELKQHLESITASNLEDFRHEAFISMCSYNGCSLGINGKGMYAVNDGKMIYLFQSANAAVERYNECLY